MIDVVVANPDWFNDYVAHNQPYQQRTGRIAQREFNRIVPNFKINVEDRKMAIKALECLSLKKVDSQKPKTNANQTFTQTGALL